MQKEYINTFSGFGKSAVDATKELVEINSRLMSKILESQIKLTHVFVESSEKQISALSNMKDPSSFVETQTALFEDYSAKMTEAAQTSAQLAQEAAEELKAWFEKGVKTGEEAVKEVAVKAAAAAPIKAPAAKAPVKKAPAKKAPAKKAPAAKPAAN